MTQILQRSLLCSPMCLQNTFDTVYILLVVQFSLGAKYDAVGPQIFCKIPVVYKFGAKFEARVPKWSAICLFQYNLHLWQEMRQ